MEIASTWRTPTSARLTSTATQRPAGASAAACLGVRLSVGIRVRVW